MPATSAPRPGAPLPHLHQNWAHACHMCARTGLAPATSARGLGSPPPRLHGDYKAHLSQRDCIRWPCRIPDTTRVPATAQRQRISVRIQRLTVRIIRISAGVQKSTVRIMRRLEPSCGSRGAPCAISSAAWPAERWAGRAQSRRRCGRGVPSPGADVAGVCDREPATTCGTFECTRHEQPGRPRGDGHDAAPPRRGRRVVRRGTRPGHAGLRMRCSEYSQGLL